MAQLDLDNFTYSNGNLATVSSGKWTKSTDTANFNDNVVASNALSSSFGMDVISTWPGSTTDHYGQITIPTLGSSGGPTLRSDSANNFYHLAINPSGTDTKIYKVVGAAFTQIGGNNIVWAVNDVAYFEMQGTTLITKQNGAVLGLLTVTGESSIASGKPGLYLDNVAFSADSWVAGDFGRASAFRLVGRPFPYKPGSPRR